MNMILFVSQIIFIKKYQSAFKNKNVKVLGQPRNDFISNNKN